MFFYILLSTVSANYRLENMAIWPFLAIEAMGGYEDKNRLFTCVACGVMRLSPPVPAGSCVGIFILQRVTVFVLFAQLPCHECIKKIHVSI